MIIELFLQKVVLAIFVGALIGLEREHTKKQEIVGLRTFSLISLLGALSVIISQEFLSNFLLVMLGFALIAFFSAWFYITGASKRKYGFTTSMAIIISYILGVFAGFGLFFEAIFLSIVIAIILFSRERLHHLVEHLTEKEVGDLLEFLVLLGIIYPIIPNEITVAGIVIPLLTIWLLIVIVSLLNFVAFISSRFMTTKHEIEAIAFLGGLVNGWAAVNSLLHIAKKKSMKHLVIGGVFIINSANILRASLLILITAPFAGIYLVPSLVVGMSMMLFFGFSRIEKKIKVSKVKISSPFNVASGIKLAALTLVLYVLFNFVQLNTEYLIILVFLSSLVSSTATIISLISLLTEGAVSEPTMAIASLFILLGALISNLMLLVIYKKSFALREALKEHLLSIGAIVVVFAITAYFFL